ncbi:MAG TPA: hypothetical protein VFW77_02395 [Candidatus Saccharimonadales bacterium]|nr:hypothetical protein [Candidatus Saccharimonadales bacterium]
MNLDAYTVRKIVPRLFFAVVGVNLSIYLCVAAVDITSVVGHGVTYLIRAPFDAAGTLHTSVDSGAALSTTPLFAVGIFAAIATLKGADGAILSTIWFLLLPVFILVLTTLITLAIRQALVVLLTLVSPVAIVLAVLPGTEKYFKQWWDLFLKTLIVYPIIAAIFAVSDVLSAISFKGSFDPNKITAATDVISGILYAFMPLAMIPFVFRMSGGVLGGFFNATQAMRSAVNRYSMGGLQKNFTEGLNTLQSAGWFRNPRSRGTGEYEKDPNAEDGFARDEDGNKIEKREYFGLRHKANLAMAGLTNVHEMSPGRPIRSLQDATQRAMAKKAQQIRESDRGKMLAGFDDELYAAIHSDGTKAGIQRALMDRAAKRFDHTAPNLTDAERTKRKKDLAAATSMIQEFNKAGGGMAGRAAAAVELHGISTSYDTQFKRKNPETGEVMNEPWIDGRHAKEDKSDQVYKRSERQMQETIFAASGGMRGLGNWITAESIKGAKQAARYDLAASASAVVMYQEAMRSGDKKAVDAMEEYYDKMMVERVTPAQMLQGHPRAAKEMSIAWSGHIDELADKLNQAAQSNDAESIEKAQEALMKGIGDIAGIQDVLGSAGKESVDAFDDGLMSKKLTVALPHVNGEAQTVEAILDAVRNDPIVSQRRHEYRRQAGLDAEAAALADQSVHHDIDPPSMGIPNAI